VSRGAEQDRVLRFLGDLRRAARWHRHLLAAGLLAGSATALLHAVAPPPPPTAAVVVAARDVAPGTTLTDDDVTVRRVDPGVIPGGALRRPTVARGRVVLGAVRRGEPLTDVRLLGPAAVDALGTGLVATPVRVADAESVRLVRPGDVVDVLAAGADPVSAARLVAAAAPVLTVPRPPGDDVFGASFGGEGGLVVLATTSETAARLAGAAVTERLSLVLRGTGPPG
jgi:Flp pilus assembly protein CpaB